jgi:hypothetical protein
MLVRHVEPHACESALIRNFPADVRTLIAVAASTLPLGMEYYSRLMVTAGF